MHDYVLINERNGKVLQKIFLCFFFFFFFDSLETKTAEATNQSFHKYEMAEELSLYLCLSLWLSGYKKKRSKQTISKERIHKKIFQENYIFLLRMKQICRQTNDSSEGKWSYVTSHDLGKRNAANGSGI